MTIPESPPRTNGRVPPRSAGGAPAPAPASTDGASRAPVDGAGAAVAREMEALLSRLLELLGEDPGREGLRETPGRVRKSLQWLTRGYRLTATDAVAGALFEERHGPMVLVRDMDLYSLCEHHMLPFFGRVHVAYVPDGRVVGLSKVARIVEVFARRLQVQERLTDQIADALADVLGPAGVGVVIEARHLCMMMRGVEEQSSTTVTSAVRGSFAESASARSEFLRLALAG